jgi:formylglycine-generating enzyme required for sulfatase activity
VNPDISAKEYSDTLIPAANNDTLGADSSDPRADLAKELPEHTITLPSFRMSRFEITNYEFASVLNTAMVRDTANPFKLLDTLTGSAGTVIRYTGYRDPFLHFHNDTLYYGTFPVYRVDSAAMTVAVSETLFSATPAVDSIKAIVLKPVEAKKNCPVTQVSWYGAALYCNLKTNLAGGRVPCYDAADGFKTAAIGTGYRLPTGDEWEFAARGGLGYAASYYPTGAFISPTLANYGSSVRITYAVAVGSYASNGFGLYDMAGNVWEWCADKVSGADSLRAIRGGSYGDEAVILRSSNRSLVDVRTMDPTAGLRVVVTP